MTMTLEPRSWCCLIHRLGGLSSGVSRGPRSAVLHSRLLGVHRAAFGDPALRQQTFTTPLSNCHLRPEPNNEYLVELKLAARGE